MCQVPSAWRSRRVLFLAVAICGTLALNASPAASENPPSTAKATGETIQQAMDAFWNTEYGTAEKLAKSVLQAPDAGKENLAEANKVLACVYVMRKAQRDALEALVRMFEIDRTARFSPDANYPPPVIQSYYTVRDSLFPGTMDVNTVAVGDFENNSVYTGKFKNYDFGAFSRALPHLITMDLVEGAGLKVVDRQRTGEILKEMQLSTSGFADPAQAVQAGKLLGAHAFIFGQYMVLSPDKVRIDARVVKTATGEVLAAKQITGDFSGKPEVFFKLEKQLMTELMATLDTALGQGAISESEKLAATYLDRKAKTLQARPGYVDGMFLTAQALQAEETKDYRTAVSRWRDVLKADPGNDLAAIRVKVLQPLAAQG
jgi:TolB-like protein